MYKLITVDCVWVCMREILCGAQFEEMFDSKFFLCGPGYIFRSPAFACIHIHHWHFIFFTSRACVLSSVLLFVSFVAVFFFVQKICCSKWSWTGDEMKRADEKW